MNIIEYKDYTQRDIIGNSRAYQIDCMEALRQTPDKFYDLAVVDPPYGININNNMGRRKGDKKSNYKEILWDSNSPPTEYFAELFRVSRNQIIWGANHFIEKMPKNSSCWLMWDKLFSAEVSFSQFELAWTSFNRTCKKIDIHPSKNNNRIHPTQKPVALYEWLLKNYAKEGDKILDTHLGSGSSRIAAYKMGFDFTGFEIDTEYFEQANERFKKAIEMPLFDVKPAEVKQTQIF